MVRATPAAFSPTSSPSSSRTSSRIANSTSSRISSLVLNPINNNTSNLISSLLRNNTSNNTDSPISSPISNPISNNISNRIGNPTTHRVLQDRITLELQAIPCLRRADRTNRALLRTLRRSVLLVSCKVVAVLLDCCKQCSLARKTKRRGRMKETAGAYR